MKKTYTIVRFALSAFCLMALLVPLPSYGADTGTIKGKIVDKADGEGIYGASVTIAGTTIGTATDMNGNFTLSNVPAKQEKISVSIVGYAAASQTVTVTAGQTAVVNLKLGQTTIMASEVIVGASLYKQDRLQVPVTVNVISREKIKQDSNPTLDKVIEDVPGVVVTRAGGQTTANIQIRGSNTYQGGAIGTRVQGFYDGFPINSPESGEIAWPAVNMNAADKVEVLKGAAATLYGSGAMGGVVNVTGHLPEKLEVKAGASLGFFDSPPSTDQSAYWQRGITPFFYNTYVGVGNKVDKLTYSLLYSNTHDDGYRQNAQNTLDDVKLKARYDIDSKQYIQLSSFYNKSNGGYAYSMPYDFYPLPSVTFTPHPEYAYDSYVNGKVFATVADFADYATAHPNGTITTAGVTRTLPASFPTYIPPITGVYAGGYVDAATYAALVNSFGAGIANYKLYDVYGDDTIQRKNGMVGLNYVNLLSDNLSLDTRYYHTYNETRIEYNPTLANQTYATGIVRTPGEFNETYSSRNGVGTKLDWRADKNNRIVAGVDGSVTDMMTTTVSATIPVKNTLKPIQEKNASAFLQDEWTVSDKLTALLSLRYDVSGIDASQAEITSGVFANLQHQTVEAWSPRVALNYKAMDDMSLRASWGNSFRAPTLSERFIRDGGMFQGTPNEALDKETMTAYELGMFKQFGDKVSLDVAGFLSDYDNLIESIINLDQTFKYRNITKARIWGVETSLNVRPSSEWAFNAAYTYMNAKNRSYVAGQNANQDLNPDPTWLPYRPEHTLSAGATFKPDSKFTLNLNGRYVGTYKSVSSYPNATRANYPGGFIVLNTGAKYQMGEGASLNLQCKNIGNVQYEEAEWFRAPGRSYVAGVDFTF
ncbi:MAG: TonB-dependent receptor [Chlorobiaceae bacterium]